MDPWVQGADLEHVVGSTLAVDLNTQGPNPLYMVKFQTPLPNSVIDAGEA